ncbi:TPA: hypothetical protein ACMEKO_000067 [Klebsiella quasipneumoniae subsp. quasipneumoniae]
MKTIVLVVLYGRENTETSTTQSLLNLPTNYKNYTLLLFNNGPSFINTEGDIHFLNLQRRFGSVFLYNDISNRSLSDIYNSMFESFTADRYIIFDDDSFFSEDYFNTSLNQDIDIHLPLISSNTDQRIYYPRKDGHIVKNIKEYIEWNGKCKIYSIGSGMIIYSSLISKFKELSQHLFDPHFALYGVDFSLFRQIEKNISSSYYVKFYINGTIHHSMTGLDKKIPKWRHEERMYDYILSIKYYSRNKHVGRFKFLLFLLRKILTRDFFNLIKYTKLFINGWHYRSDGTLDLFNGKNGK